ncbi:hypothetical protein LZ32DRAFT_300120 [Colletotrichum eremochloae]|nr:hypothetical protein LZ32DRAFT_300120 [Colletotrichum eremochloae]
MDFPRSRESRRRNSRRSCFLFSVRKRWMACLVSATPRPFFLWLTAVIILVSSSSSSTLGIFGYTPLGPVAITIHPHGRTHARTYGRDTGTCEPATNSPPSRCLAWREQMALARRRTPNGCPREGGTQALIRPRHCGQQQTEREREEDRRKFWANGAHRGQERAPSLC